jgi:hypothetical protein
VMNGNFSIKQCSRHCFHPRFLHSHFLSFFEPFIPSNTLVLDKQSSPYALFYISDISVIVFFNSTENLKSALGSILKPSTQRKK